ncbi:MAG: hypothetical protein ACRC7O_18490, partial [Fimbriiglobus sp.]
MPARPLGRSVLWGTAVTIAAVCPHCDAEFQLNPDLVGKAMRCPECREAFQVRPVVAESPPVPAPVPVPAPNASGSVGDFVPVLEVEAAEPPPVPVRESYSPIPTQILELPFERVEGEALEVVPEPVLAADVPKAKPKPGPVPVAAFAREPKAPRPPKPVQEIRWDDGPPEPPTASTGPRELNWSDTAPAPAAEPLLLTSDDIESPADETPYVRRKRKSPWPFRIAATLVVTIVGLLAATGYNYLRYVAKTEEREAGEAETVYTGGNFPGAVKKYDDLLAKFPLSPSLEKYQFMKALADTRAVVDDISTRENPDPARDKLAAFITEFGS